MKLTKLIFILFVLFLLQCNKALIEKVQIIKITDTGTTFWTRCSDFKTKFKILQKQNLYYVKCGFYGQVNEKLKARVTYEIKDNQIKNITTFEIIYDEKKES